MHLFTEQVGISLQNRDKNNLGSKELSVVIEQQSDLTAVTSRFYTKDDVMRRQYLSVHPYRVLTTTVQRLLEEVGGTNAQIST